MSKRGPRSGWQATGVGLLGVVLLGLLAVGVSLAPGGRQTPPATPRTLPTLLAVARASLTAQATAPAPIPTRTPVPPASATPALARPASAVTARLPLTVLLGAGPLDDGYWPAGFAVGADGSFWIGDGPAHLAHYAPDGRSLGALDLTKPVQRIYDFKVGQTSLWVLDYSSRMDKPQLLHLSAEGQVLAQYPLPKPSESDATGCLLKGLCTLALGGQGETAARRLLGPLGTGGRGGHAGAETVDGVSRLAAYLHHRDCAEPRRPFHYRPAGDQRADCDYPYEQPLEQRQPAGGQSRCQCLCRRHRTGIARLVFRGPFRLIALCGGRRAAGARPPAGGGQLCRGCPSTCRGTRRHGLSPAARTGQATIRRLALLPPAVPLPTLVPDTPTPLPPTPTPTPPWDLARLAQKSAGVAEIALIPGYPAHDRGWDGFTVAQWLKRPPEGALATIGVYRPAGIPLPWPQGSTRYVLFLQTPGGGGCDMPYDFYTVTGDGAGIFVVQDGQIQQAGLPAYTGWALTRFKAALSPAGNGFLPPPTPVDLVQAAQRAVIIAEADFHESEPAAGNHYYTVKVRKWYKRPADVTDRDGGGSCPQL